MGQAAPAITAVVAVAASFVAGPEVGAAIIETMGVTEASAATVAAVGSAAIGGSTSAVNAAIQGKDLEGVLKAGAEGAAASAVGSEVASAIGPDVLPADQAGPPAPVEPATKIAQGAAGGATTGFTRSELSGSNLQQAIRQAEIGGATGATTAAISEGLKGAGVPSDDAKLTTALAGPFISQDYSRLFAPQKSASTTGSRPGAASSAAPTDTTQAGYGPTTQFVGAAPTTGQVSPGSAALGQALRIGDPGAPIESPGGGETSRQPVWNIASLRVKDETGSSA
jgi:hypothetical protein